jgi:hypothetical protein
MNGLLTSLQTDLNFCDFTPITQYIQQSGPFTKRIVGYVGISTPL